MSSGPKVLCFIFRVSCNLSTAAFNKLSVKAFGVETSCKNPAVAKCNAELSATPSSIFFR